MKDDAVQITVRLPLALLQRVEEVARREHRSRNRQVERYVELGIASDPVAESVNKQPA